MRFASSGVPGKCALPRPYVNVSVHKGRDDTASLHSYSLMVITGSSWDRERGF